MNVVSVIIPCRNEAKYIGAVLQSIVNSDYPLENIEVLVVDGNSNDGTTELIEQFCKKYSCVKLLSNPYETVPYAMNIGIAASNGDIIVRMDAHSIYPENYISELVHYLIELNADNVGGIWITKPANNSLMAQSIALALANPFGVGDATYRLGNITHPLEVDTVPYGCYKKSVFGKIGLYDTDLIRNQDNELNTRLKNSGGKIFLIPTVKCIYFARENYYKLWKMFYQYGYFGPLVDIKLKHFGRLRRYIPSIFVLSLVIPMLLMSVDKIFGMISLFVVVLYTIANLIFSTRAAIANRNMALIPFICVSFLVSHLSYGFGYIKGFIDFRLLRKHKRQFTVSLSR